MVHISARVAWHLDGWNGRICSRPEANTYCIGPYSYPGTMIAEQRDLPWEQAHRGCTCTKDVIPPCMYSVNAFGSETTTAYAVTPEWFHDEDRVEWEMPPSTVCIWPYELMYEDDVRQPNGGFNYELRREKARRYFEEIQESKSLIFYYANYSNPFSDDEQRRYVLVGLSRVKAVGPELVYRNVSRETRERWGGYVWQRAVTSHYPDEGMRIPYHVYMDRPEVLHRIALFPDNPRNFKYGTRHISDDDALVLVERFLEVATTLQEIGDQTEDWPRRIAWLQGLIAELWRERGLYPGLPAVLKLIRFTQAIPWFKVQVGSGREAAARDLLFDFLDGNASAVPGLTLAPNEIAGVRKRWLLYNDDQRHLLREVFPRFDLREDQMERILADDREAYGIRSSLREIAANPYILAEEFVGEDQDDTISFHKIDHGMLPSPHLGGAPLAEVDDWRRLRALCVEHLKRETRSTFLPAAEVLERVNRRLDPLPEWKRTHFSEGYLRAYREELAAALVVREHDGKPYLYLRTVYEDERLVEETILGLVRRPDISLRSPVTAQHWRAFLYDPHSPLCRLDAGEYEAAIQSQVEVCQKIFVRPLCVLSGSAGTGKTTVIRALIQAIEKAHGSGSSFRLLAPTGKAADRIRERTGKEAETVHAFLARLGWLNDNLTFKRSGGRQEDSVRTYIIDEASMLNLELVAALCRAIHWGSVQRVIFVGDTNQLPPIGRGKVFADLIAWLREAGFDQSVGMLTTNLRQMENRLLGQGTGILDLAALYQQRPCAETDSADETEAAEEILRRVQEGGDVDKDLRVIYWSGYEELEAALIDCIIRDMEADTGRKCDPDRPWELWAAAFGRDPGPGRPEYQQVLSPYRGDTVGTEYLNSVLQQCANQRMLEEPGTLGGVTLYDKVIQVRNRPRSNPIWAWNADQGRPEQIEVYNGELGFVYPHKLDKLRLRSLERFQVVFPRKGSYRVGYGRNPGFGPNRRPLPAEPVEDNLELAYAISVHKSQGSEFDRVYFVVPKNRRTLLSPELFYTGLTRARRHCTLLVEEDISPLLSMRRRENSSLVTINSSLFRFQPVPEALKQRADWYAEGKIHRTLADIMVRSKSEVIIANMLFERDIRFQYEVPLYAPDGTFYLPDFTITWHGEEWYWEHVGLLTDERYRRHWEEKRKWYDRFFPGRLVVTFESGNLSKDAEAIIARYFS